MSQPVSLPIDFNLIRGVFPTVASKPDFTPIYEIFEGQKVTIRYSDYSLFSNTLKLFSYPLIKLSTRYRLINMVLIKLFLQFYVQFRLLLPQEYSIIVIDLRIFISYFLGGRIFCKNFFTEVFGLRVGERVRSEKIN